MNNLIAQFLEDTIEKNKISPQDYLKHNVKRGLRNENGTGVLVGLTKISDVQGYEINDGNKINIEGRLYYRDIELKSLVKKTASAYHDAYEQTMFLLLFAYLPSKEELIAFKSFLFSQTKLNDSYLRDNILNLPSKDIMNKMQRSVLMLYSYDDDPDNTDVFETLNKGVSIIAKMPLIISYAQQAKIHFFEKQSMTIRHYKKDLSIAENILHLARNESAFSDKEAEILDLLLVIHAEHGGANNSTFTNIVISSTGTDIYSALSGAIGSLKGPKHGGANKKVNEMILAIKKEIGISCDDEEIKTVLNKILDKNFYDNSGLIYGIGHAVYTLSDPRTILLKDQTKDLAIEKDRIEEYFFFAKIETISQQLLKERKGEDFNCCANVDFYSGFVYDMLNIPIDLITPIFATSRMIGWLAHNLENKLYCNRIIRPASKYVSGIQK